MGMTVEASIPSRALAELATGPVDDDARKDEDHAGDTEEVHKVLWAGPVMACVRTAEDMNDDVGDAGKHHHHEPEHADQRDPTKFPHHLSLYR
ncbi:MAG: hypothetical protein ACT4OQ_10080 [Chloroflexota bacterium]